jgi:hypothetical protein
MAVAFAVASSFPTVDATVTAFTALVAKRPPHSRGPAHYLGRKPARFYFGFPYHPASADRTAPRSACMVKRDGGSRDGVSCAKCSVDTLARSGR